MKLLNIAAKGRSIYLFNRDEKGNQSIIKDTSFYPYFFEPHSTGVYKGYDGVPLKKIFVSEPRDIVSLRSKESYSSDIPFVKNYLTEKVDCLEKTSIKYFFIDIEVLAKEIPDLTKANYPVSCVTIYNSLNKEIKTWWLKDYIDDKLLLEDVIKYFQAEKPDLLLAWNINFDYTYLHNRIKNWAKKISPIHEVRGGSGEGIFYPAGISILDYLGLFKKVYMREAGYSLDYISQKHLGEETWGKSDFSTLNEDVRDKNINDVKRMVKLEDKYKILNYYDEIRRLTKCQWEDLFYNSFILEMLLFEEAKNMKIVLPNSPKNEERQSFDGATREAAETGALYGIGKYDLTSAYPSMIVNFCLDSKNIGTEGIKINGYNFKQDENTLIPSLVRKILVLKDNIKKELKSKNPDSDEYKQVKTKYDAIKAVVNSAFGVMGLPVFRLFDSRIASTITFLVRELLMFTKEEVEKLGYKVVYWDTDGIFIKSEKSLLKELNEIVNKWAKLHGKDKVGIEFEYEGIFEKIFIVSKCRYYGYLRNDKGIKPEIKGVEVKRSNSSKFESKFQEELINKILDGARKETILDWVEIQKERIKELPFSEVAFPCKLTIKEYKNEPIFKRAYSNTQYINPKFKIDVGEIFYYIFVKNMGYDNKNRPLDVIAIKDSDTINKSNIDYDEIIRRNIITKTENIFEAMGWGSYTLASNNQTSLF